MSEAACEADALLVVRLGAMGDILHALPAVASLKLSFPDRQLIWVVDRLWAPLLAGNPHVGQVISFERRRSSTWLPARRELRANRYSFAVDFQGLIKSAVVAKLSGAGRIFGFSRNEVRERPAALLYTDEVSSASVHRVDRALDLAAATGATILTKDFCVPAGKPEADLPDSPFVLACPFAGWVSKQWPLEYFDRLGAMLQRETGLQLVLNAAPSAHHLLSAVANARMHLSGIAGLIDATRRATAVIGVDSGPLHLAAALRKPGVAIYGPTDPAVNGPYGGTIRVLRAAGAPTSYAREDTIAPSMLQIMPEEVLRELQAQKTHA
jgi:heptosyltransferase-1